MPIGLFFFFFFFLLKGSLAQAEKAPMEKHTYNLMTKGRMLSIQSNIWKSQRCFRNMFCEQMELKWRSLATVTKGTFEEQRSSN